MTAAEIEVSPESAAAPNRRSLWRPWLAFGTGVALEIAGTDLELALVRLRPSSPQLLRRVTIARFDERPAAEWVEQYRELVRGHDPAGITVLLPRRDVIVRHVQLPGVTSGDLAGALALRLRALHPFPEDDVAWCWSPVSNGALVGLARASVLGRYESLFEEAGIPVSCFTFSASVLYGAVRLYGLPALPFLGISENGAGQFEAYGENAAGLIFSGEFAGSAARAAAAGASELRLPPSAEPVGMARLLPLREADAETGPARDRPLLFAAAIANASPLLLRPANFLPPDKRAGQSRIWLIPTAILATLLILCAAAFLAIGPWREHRLVATLRDEIARTQPAAQRAALLERQANHAASQIQLLDEFRGRARADFDVLNELTRILPPPAWTSNVEIFPDFVIVAGEAEQAAPLLKLIDASPLFQNSEFTNSVTRSGKNELFRIKAYRRNK